MKPIDGSSQPSTHPRPNNSAPESQATGLNGSLTPYVAPAPPNHQSIAATPTAGALLMSLKRRWLLAAVLAPVAAALTVAAVAAVYPPKYVAQARLELASRPNRPLLLQNGSDQDIDPGVYRANQQALIKSPLVLTSALNNDKLRGLKIKGLSPEALEKDIKTDLAPGSDVLTIKLLGEEPDELADMLNAIVQAYKDEIDSRDNVRKSQLVKQLEKSLSDNQVKLAGKRSDLTKFEEQEGIPDAKAQEALLQAMAFRVANVENNLRTVSTELGAKKVELTLAKTLLMAGDDLPVPQAKLKRELGNSLIMQQYTFDLKKIEDQITEWSTYQESKQKRDKLADLAEKKKATQTTAKAAEDALRPELEKSLRADRQDELEQDVRKLEGLVRSLEYQEDGIRKDMIKLKDEYRDLNPANRRGNASVEKLRDDVKEIERTQEILAGQVALHKAEPAASSRVVVLQTANTPTHMDFSRLMKMGTAAGMGAFGLVLFGVAFLEFRSRKVNGAEEVIQGLNMPLVGTMPHLPARARRPVNGSATERDLHWQSIITESVDAIRTQLVHSARGEGVQVVMITSANSGEGKTSLASQLAASLARAWRKTLLVDGDLRNPAAHKLFDLQLEPGLCEVLRGEASLEDAVKPTLLSRLWLLPAGHWDAHAIQALAQDGVHAKFNQMKEQYDFIIVDSCPILPVADALLLGQHVDGVIFSVLRGVSRLPSLHAAQQRLYGIGVRVLGAVVIGGDGDRASSVYTYAAQAHS